MIMKINVLKKGDRVISVTSEFVAVQRKNGEVDIVSLIRDGTTLRVAIENIVTIGYGNNTVEAATGDVVVTTF